MPPENEPLNGIVSIDAPLNFVSVQQPPPFEVTTVELSSSHIQHSDNPEDDVDSDMVLHIGNTYLKLTNTVQRIVSACLLAPLLIALVWLSPIDVIPITITIVSFLGAYEFAWLAVRIQSQLELAARHYEDVEERLAVKRRNRQATTQAEDDVEEEEEKEDAANQSEEAEEVFMLRIFSKRDCAIAPFAQKCTGDNQWIGALVAAVPITAITVSVDLFLVLNLPFVNVPKELDSTSQLIYLVSTRFLASIAALFTPTAESAVMLLFQLELFNMMALQTLSCGMGKFVCTTNSDMFSLFTVGVVVILCTSAVLSKDPITLVVKSLLNIIGFVYVYGLNLALLSLLDVTDVDSSRNVLVALLSMVWAADAGAYYWFKMMLKHSDSYSNSTSSSICTEQLSPKEELECSLVSIGCSAVTMIALAQILKLPGGSMAVYMALAMGSSFAGRLGALFLNLLKRAARVKRSGKCIPGHGGVLDRMDSLLFAAIVFGQYLAHLPDFQRNDRHG